MKPKIILAAGDALVFMVFAWTGRTSHHETVGASGGALIAVVGTAAPFLAAWFAVATVLGTYRTRLGQGRQWLIGRVALTWVLAWPVGLLVRALAMRRGVPLSFAVITLLVNMLLLLVWRGLAALFVAHQLARSSLRNKSV